MLIPLTDLRTQYHAIEDEINTAILEIVRRGEFIMGREVTVLEREIAAYCGIRYAVGVASGTDALRLALLACDIGPGDEVITTPFTFVATVETIVECGAVPIFVDIEPYSFNMNTSLIEEKITSKTKAILPVHLYGRCVDMEPVIQIARHYNLRIIEDCAQATAAEYKGRKAGSLGDVGCLSFFPSKNLGAYGDGGMIVTDDAEIADTVCALRKHGDRNGNKYTLLGYNSRLDTLQAAILLVKLKRLDEWIELRRQKADLYNCLLHEIAGITPAYAERYNKHSYNYYTIRVESDVSLRDELRAYLNAEGIQTKVYYSLALHLQDAYHYLGYALGDFPVAEKAQTQVLSLPMYPELTDEHVRIVADKIRAFFSNRRFEPVT